jgi:transcriptional regulator with XRE-family HTH domain
VCRDSILRDSKVCAEQGVKRVRGPSRRPELIGDEVVRNVGRQLRRLRQSRGLTLSELATRAGCSDGYLSGVETGAITPTLSSISTLAAVLGADLGAFFGGEPEDTIHVHRAGSGQRLRISPTASQTYTILSARRLEPSFTGLVEDLAPTPDDTSYRYFGERFLVLLEGSVVMGIGAEEYALGPFDTLHYSSHPAHRVRVTSDVPARILWVVTPALL